MRTVGIMAAAAMLFSGFYLAVLSLRGSKRANVDRLREVLTSADQDAVPGEDRSALANLWSELSRAAEGVSKSAGWTERLDKMLTRAEIKLSSGEFLVGLVGASIGAALLFAVALRGPLFGLFGLIVTPMLIFLTVQRRAGKQVERLDGQLPDALDQLASSMRSGYSLGQAMEAASEVLADPLGREFARTIAETRVGRSLEEAMSATAERVGSVDLAWSIKALQIQARTGGAVADILGTLAEFMRDREEVRREIRVLTAEGRISAVFLLAVPFLVTGAIVAFSPGYLRPLVEEPLGLVMIGGAVVMMIIGTFVIRQIVKVEV